ncbi:MAG: hypothetical protein ACTSVG_12670 [Alphaproteobacteria bacterium]
MPALNSSLDLGAGVSLGELRGDLDLWIERLPDTAEQVAFDVSARARLEIQQIGNGTVAVVASLAERIGFPNEQIEPVISALGSMVKVLRTSLSAFKAAAKAFLADQVADLIKMLSEAVVDLLESLADLSKLCAAIPVAGWIVAACIQMVKACAAVGRLFQSWFDKPKRPFCEFLDLAHWAGPADRNAASDLLALTDLRFNSGDITRAFLPPPERGMREIEMYGGIHSRISGFCFAPVIGSDLCAQAPVWLSETPPENGAERGAWKAAWFRAAYFRDPGPWLRGPWLSGRESRCEPTRRGNIASMTKAQQTRAERSVQPLSVYPKATAIAGSLFSQASGVGPLSLCVDWHAIGSAWANAFITDDPARGWLAKSGSAGTVGGCKAQWVGRYTGSDPDPLAHATFIYDHGPDRTVLPFSTRFGPPTGIGPVALPPDFVDFLETKMPGLPVQMFPDGYRAGIYGDCAAPNGTAHGIHTIRYACLKLAERQQTIARTDAAAYVPAQVLKTSPIRHILEDTRARILAGGARGVDLDMARNTGGDEWRAACLSAKKTSLVQGTPPPPASSAGSSDLTLPVSDPAGSPSGGGGGGALLALGGLAAAVAVLGGGRA